ncbi:MAG: InlB B-repeat-containing protein [Oscillospiraceae bacterium]
MKKKLAMAIAALLLFSSIAPPALANDGAPTDLAQGGGVSARLAHIEKESGYTVGTPEYNCYLFVKRVFNKLYEYDRDPNINYHGDYDSATYTTQLVGRLYTPYPCSIVGCGGHDPVSTEAKSYTIGAVTAGNVSVLLARAEPGDVLQGHSGNNVHTMIIENINRAGDTVKSVDVYHGNYNSMISRNTFTVEHLAKTYDHALSVYHAANYDLIDIGAAVYFEPTGGVASFKSAFIDGGGTIGELPTATRIGYNFDGWYSSEKGGYAADPATVPTQFELTYYAHWSPQTYTLNFDVNSGGIVPEPISVKFGSTYGKLPSAGERNGYTMSGWSLSPDASAMVLSDTEISIPHNHTLYACWTPNEYKVSFSAMGGKCDAEDKTVVYGEPYGQLPIPTREGYIFTGWATDEHGVNRRTSTTPAVKSSDHTLYAQWEKGLSAAPTELVATASGVSATLSWSAAEQASGYMIYRRAAGEEFFTRLGSVDGGSTTSFTDLQRPSGSACEYKVRAYLTIMGGTIYGDWSNIAPL